MIESVWNDELQGIHRENEYKNADQVRAVYKDILTVGRGVFKLRLEDIVVNIPGHLSEHYEMTRCMTDRNMEYKMDEVYIEKSLE